MKIVNETFDELGLEKYPDKTFIGRTDQGLDDSHFGRVVKDLEAELFHVGASRIDVAGVMKLAVTLRVVLRHW